jgi:hypothetical protein
MDQEELQEREDVYLNQLNSELQGKVWPVKGDWQWPSYGINGVSAVVVGHRHREPPADGMEIVYLVTISSSASIPNVGKTLREPTKKGYYTFVQLAASVQSDGCWTTQFLSTYVGTDPYPPSASTRAKGKEKAKTREAAEPTDDGTSPPHPPP